MKPVEYLDKVNYKQDFKTSYVVYRLGRIKHELWLKNRKTETKVLYNEDSKILDKCKQGKTCILYSAGYYIKDLFPDADIDVIEKHTIVKDFYPQVIICQRHELDKINKKYDNVIVTNNRNDHWTDLNGLKEYFLEYKKIMSKDCNFFYSLRDTQMLGFNRLKINMKQMFLDWAKSMYEHGFELLEYDIQFPEKKLKPNGEFNLEENPDTTNGNVKFLFRII